MVTNIQLVYLTGAAACYGAAAVTNFVMKKSAKKNEALTPDQTLDQLAEKRALKNLKKKLKKANPIEQAAIMKDYENELEFQKIAIRY